MTTERSSEISSPYAAQPAVTSADAPATASAAKPFDLDAVKKVRTVHLAQAKATGQKFSMLTCYDALTAQVFDRAGIEMLLVGDSAANVVLGYESTLTITLDEMIPMVAAVSRGASRAMVVADLPFGSYEQSPQQAVASAVRLMKEGGAHAVKIEADASMTEWVRALVRTGIPVVAHVGFTPQSEHALGGFRVQGRGEAAERVREDAVALAEAGAFCVLMEMVTTETARRVDEAVGAVPTIGIGASNVTTGQVLVWQDMMGLREGRVPRFVKQFAQIGKIMEDAARAYREQVRSGEFPAAEHTFE
ncbi:MAG: 3-methyl-2-oxobutanoate hydroxymethyltransferase [Rothia sp.]|uniref:3-methyl-2-oxobutanoate hydroxymethyltransferase n=1 Tax=Rothia sp. (in: high G+C Gram-positive bacteria) TaxID=1885016 RepID=UPI001CACFF74|nr:3-methyl-2-oxobutanoate hydroxymethyltransferase [Rothia sp. (in: high G+C Gram-positive bacteria)]MBF1680610.1 3-methyl-2-oxobutanoate hydroxymethyltransferase [Rothia sp. (in: high G+C Gram-positive bacteria)]